MIDSLSTSATGMQAQEKNLDTIANNLANINTTGFKKSRAEFEDLYYRTLKEPGSATSMNSVHPTGIQIGMGVKTGAVTRDFSEGSIKITNRPLDLAVEGHGFFPIQIPRNGQISYTRAGVFKLDNLGRLTTPGGYPLIPEIIVPPDALKVNISGDGMVSVLVSGNKYPQEIGQIQLVNFVNPPGLKGIGQNLYLPTVGSGDPMQGIPGSNNLGTVMQGALESSNVNTVEEMVNMISAQRAYEANSKVIQASDQILQYTNNLR